MNKEGKDIYECSIEAEQAGREKAIEPGEPAYRKIGREAFIKMLNEHENLTPELANELADDYVE